jgi:4-hydroxy-tetrahydrodipicolinate synthase
VISAVGGDRVIAGAGGNDTREVVHLAKMSSEAGSRALLTVAPYYNKPSQEGLYRHFRAIADATPLLVLLYNVPGRTITNIEPVTAARLGRDAATIVGIKEASSDMIHVGELFRQTPEEFDVYCGDDGILLQHLALGGAGVISVTSHVAGPDIAAIYRAWFAREPGEAARIFLRTLPITRALFSAPSPAPTKYALAWRGLPVGGVRLPLVDLTELEQRVVETALREYGLTPHSPG